MARSPIDACLDNSSHLLSFHRPLSHPAHYQVLAESPFAADSEAWKLALPEKLVNRGWVNSE
jgi:hypothetical protein